MLASRRTVGPTLVAAFVSLLFGACSMLGGPAVLQPAPAAVVVKVTGPSAVSQWDAVATTTINVPAAPAGTPQEQRPNSSVDLATVHVAMYDAAMAITPTHRPFVVTPSRTRAAGASQEAAVGAAAYNVLRGLYPGRSAQYQPAYDAFLRSLPEGTAKSDGVAIGAEVAAGVLARRADDGRSVALAPYVPGSAPGQFRGQNPIIRNQPFIRPFGLTSTAQFRAPGPPALSSAVYAADVAETRALGSAQSTVRTAEQLELARFHTESPLNFWPRNLRKFSMTDSSLAEQARLTAMLWVTLADVTGACFESKYHFQLWRPLSAIALADTDGNDATVADPGWAPIVPTPNHPEYPAAHSCYAGAIEQVLRTYYQTANVSFDVDSAVTGSTHRFSTTSGLVDEIQLARIAGGMHLRSATVDGAALGRNVAAWILARNFQPR